MGTGNSALHLAASTHKEQRPCAPRSAPAPLCHVGVYALRVTL